MKLISASDVVAIPEGCSLTVDRRIVTITGPRGTLVKNFKHLQCELVLNTPDQNILIKVHFPNRKAVACVRTICSHIKNMFTGVIQGFKYKMKSVYAHFPININIQNENNMVEVHNFLGEKFVRKVPMLEGVTCSQTGNKDEIQVEGNDIENVSRTAALIQQSTTVKNKDIRKFLDGVYVSEKTNITMLEE